MARSPGLPLSPHPTFLCLSFPERAECVRASGCGAGQGWVEWEGREGLTIVCFTPGLCPGLGEWGGSPEQGPCWAELRADARPGSGAGEGGRVQHPRFRLPGAHATAPASAASPAVASSRGEHPGTVLPLDRKVILGESFLNLFIRFTCRSISVGQVLL